MLAAGQPWRAGVASAAGFTQNAGRWIGALLRHGVSDEQDPAGDHVRGFGHPGLAGVAREPAQAVHSADRRPVDLPVGGRPFGRPVDLRAAGGDHQFRLSFSGRRATEGDRRGGDDPARAGAARQRRGGRGGGRLGGGARSCDGGGGAGGRPCVRGGGEVRRAVRPGRGGGGSRRDRHLRGDARPSGDGLRLHPSGGGAGGRSAGAAGRALRREAGRGEGEGLHCGRAICGTRAISCSAPR